MQQLSHCCTRSRCRNVCCTGNNYHTVTYVTGAEMCVAHATTITLLHTQQLSHCYTHNKCRNVLHTQQQSHCCTRNNYHTVTHVTGIEMYVAHATITLLKCLLHTQQLSHCYTRNRCRNVCCTRNNNHTVAHATIITLLHT